VNAAWSGLQVAGHRHDTILIGETAPRGLEHPIGDFGGVKPLRFLRALYCVGSDYRPLRGAAARARGCPTTTAGSRAFATQNQRDRSDRLDLPADSARERRRHDRPQPLSEDRRQVVGHLTSLDRAVVFGRLTSCTSQPLRSGR
jgi:hypothetical protein